MRGASHPACVRGHGGSGGQYKEVGDGEAYGNIEVNKSKDIEVDEYEIVEVVDNESWIIEVLWKVKGEVMFGGEYWIVEVLVVTLKDGHEFIGAIEEGHWGWQLAGSTSRWALNCEHKLWLLLIWLVFAQFIIRAESGLVQLFPPVSGQVHRTCTSETFVLQAGRLLCHWRKNAVLNRDRVIEGLNLALEFLGSST